MTQPKEPPKSTPAKERRNKQKAVPDNIKDYLNHDQIIALNQIESFGWTLEFVRRPLFQEPTPVVFGPDRKQIGILLKDGTIDKNPGIQVRN
jgi:hypothetical protein